jgi:hypothetical protein
MKPKLPTTSLLILCLVACQVATAQLPGPNLVKDGDAESGKLENLSAEAATLAVTSKEEAAEGNHAFSITLPEGIMNRNVFSSELIPVSPEKTYQLSVMLKSASTAQSEQVHVGLIPFDADGNEIIAQSVNHLPDTETELTEDVNAEDDVVKVKKADHWQAGPVLYVAFDIDGSGKFSDLPNNKLSGIGIKAVTDKGSYWEIQLEGKARQSYPAGTKVREHTAGSSYIYCSALYKTIPTEWTEFSGTVTGISPGRSDIQFWPGTHSVKVVILPGVRPDERLLVDNIVFQEVAP